MLVEPKNVTVYAKTLRVNLSPMAYHRWAEEYLAAAESIPDRDGFSPVPYYLHGLAAELGLKAFLLAKNHDRRTLAKRRLGHDLDALLQLAEQAGLSRYTPVTLEARSQVSLLRGYYKARDLEYFPLAKALRGFPELPNLVELSQFTSRLLTDIKAECVNAC